MPFRTDYANNHLNYIFGKITALPSPSKVYMGLSTNDPEADGGTFTELSGKGYARVLVAQRGESFPNYLSTATERKMTNQYQINWTKATAEWAEAKGFGFFEVETGGTPFFYGALDEPVTCSAGAVMLFDPQAFQIKASETDVEIEE